MILKTEKISKAYKNGEKELVVFKDVNFVLNAGGIITIMGPSGAGKTTLLNILGSLEQPDSGFVEIDGVNLKDMNEDELSLFRNQKLGFVFQFHHLLPEFTAFENVMMPAFISGKQEEVKARASELFDYVNLGSRTTHYPSQLSGGERLRVAVLRAIICNPAIVLADEPTGNLDIDNAQKLLDLFLRINRDFGQSFVITTHNPEVANIGQRRFYMSNETLLPSESI